MTTASPADFAAASAAVPTSPAMGQRAQRLQPNTSERPAWSTTLAVVLSLVSGLASAQAVFRSVGPDGRVTFSDRPTPSAPATATEKTTGAAADTATARLPYELQQINQKYPVTLYTAPRCGPCDTGRKLLTERGIPFTEKTITTSDDQEAFGRLSQDNSLPLLTIAGQKITGFSNQEWTQYLDKAGYPKQSALPLRYVQTPAAPLVPIKPLSDEPAAVDSPAANPSKATAKPTRPKPTVQPSNPAGIRF